MRRRRGVFKGFGSGIFWYCTVGTESWGCDVMGYVGSVKR